MNLSTQQAKYVAGARKFDGLRWKSLEMEEQALARSLIRDGLATIVGTGPERTFQLKGTP